MRPFNLKQLRTTPPFQEGWLPFVQEHTDDYLAAYNPIQLKALDFLAGRIHGTAFGELAQSEQIELVQLYKTKIVDACEFCNETQVQQDIINAIKELQKSPEDIVEPEEILNWWQRAHS